MCKGQMETPTSRSVLRPTTKQSKQSGTDRQAEGRQAGRQSADRQTGRQAGRQMQSSRRGVTQLKDSNLHGAMPRVLHIGVSLVVVRKRYVASFVGAPICSTLGEVVCQGYVDGGLKATNCTYTCMKHVSSRTTYEM